MAVKRCMLEGCSNPAKRKFCCNVHKDKYHNKHNPRGRFSYLNEYGGIDEDLHPFSCEGLGQWMD